MHYFSFKPAAEVHRDLIHSWLKQKELAEWIHGPGLENTLLGLEKFINHEKGLESDRQTPLTQHWLAYMNEHPFAYLLTSNVSADSVYAPYRQEKGSAITLDLFIGDDTFRGKGLATKLIHEFLIGHFSDVAEVFIDPEKTNARAIHVYQKAGFKIVGEFVAAWHPVPHYLMKLPMRELLHLEVRA